MGGGALPPNLQNQEKGEEPKLGFWGDTLWRSLGCHLKGQRPEVLPWQSARWFHLSAKMRMSLGTGEGSGAPLLTPPGHTPGLCHPSPQLWGQPSPQLLLTRAQQGGAPLSHNPRLTPRHAGRDPSARGRVPTTQQGWGSTRGGLSDQGSCHHTWSLQGRQGSWRSPSPEHRHECKQHMVGCGPCRNWSPTGPCCLAAAGSVPSGQPLVGSCRSQREPCYQVTAAQGSPPSGPTRLA